MSRREGVAVIRGVLTALAAALIVGGFVLGMVSEDLSGGTITGAALILTGGMLLARIAEVEGARP